MFIGIIVAMESEYNSIKDILVDPKTHSIGSKTFLYGDYKNHHLIICVGGIGKANAAATAAFMISSFPAVEMIVSTGCAGGIVEGLNVGDIVVGKDCCYHDVWCPMTPDTKRGELPGNPRKFNLRKAMNLLDHDIFKDFGRAFIGHIYTGDQFIQTAEECKKIRSLYPDDKTAGICEMETTAIAQVCAQTQRMLFSFRVVSDVPANQTNKEDHMKQYEDFWKSMSDRSYSFLKLFLDSIKTEIK